MACDMSPPGSLRSSRERGQENVLVMTDIVFLLQAQTAFLQGERKGQENVLVMTDIVFLLQAQTAFLQGERKGQENVLVMTDIVFLLQAQTAFLQGERKGQENVLVMTDIVFLLQAQTAFLQGERKGQENLKKDLVRRIKMLEYVLKQERAKYHKLKYGTELNQGDMKPPSYESDEVNENEAPGSLNNQLSWKQGRQLLRQYLQEVGYTDTILDVKAQRVQTLLAMAGAGGGRPGERTGPETPLVNGTDTVP
ncbi:striatin-like [Oncorhynchus keta]|uniref:striatin-like n=1 Tax=Oncorhynchus keta TaxID=8018 RepID=UPI00227D36AC|nr:striatin-like [Oncorhynchus keta]